MLEAGNIAVTSWHDGGVSDSPTFRPAAMTPVIRRAGPTDAAALEPLMIAFDAAEHIAWDAERVRPAIARLLESDDAGVIVVAEAGALVGYVVVTWGFDLEFAGRDAFVTEIFVDAAHRGHRLGSALLDAAMDAARAGGAVALHLLVDPANAPALAMYVRAAFERSHRTLMTRML
jgi:ribosomal protein S18 acetylase RimI-like enzyme